MTLAQLYSLAYERGFPHSAAKDIIHEMARVDFRVPVSRLTDGMRDRIALSIQGMRYRPDRDRKASRTPERTITDRHRDEIRTLASLLGWTTSTLDRFLLRSVGAVGIHGLSTADQADQVIQMMRAVRDHRTAKTQRTPR